jgi:putative redox protein
VPDAARATRSAREHDHVRTSCGRNLTIGRLALGGGSHPAGRVFVDLGDCPDCGDSSWAGLTVAEARDLARALLAQAEAAERDGLAGCDPLGRLAVRHVDGDVYAITARGHDVLVDQPVADGGRDAAVTPTELLVASLASCVAFYTGRYLLRHHLDRSGLTVTAEFALAADRPARVGAVRLRITVPGGVPPQRTDALLAVASHCTVHNTLRQHPDISIELAGRDLPEPTAKMGQGESG